ncbi:DNA-binding transcriptional regulator, LysR family [Brevibacterium aurantiacum]|uniref:DNA-binding transcriptional regulator, LysR family n=1 Tax=Brevibacterium aurantiacum TaxID=273384 RepID=A0A2H1JVG2_BREAU|nr:LysR family transcriptional regulator [Brevibacterium aurantiacum]SMX91032.1 DNA-binding transcriptional regulator, LysR family [Brevibacterium aurantiacum]
MDRRSLEYFLAVVDTGSSSAAADTVHVSQPTISVAVKGLEKELGGALFVRTPTGLTPTAAGRSLIGPARQVMRDFEIAHESVRDTLGLRGGEIDIGTVPALAMSWLNQHIVNFRLKHPSVTVRVHLENDDRLINDRVRDGRYNLGLTVTAPNIVGLSTRHVGSQNLVALLPPGSPGAGEPIDIGELAHRDLITMQRGHSSSRRWLETELGQRGIEPQIGVVLGTPFDIVPMVAAGIGYALWWSPMYGESDCVVRPIRPAYERPINLIKRDQAQSPASLAFLAIVERSSESESLPVNTEGPHMITHNYTGEKESTS